MLQFCDLFLLLADCIQAFIELCKIRLYQASLFFICCFIKSGFEPFLLLKVFLLFLPHLLCLLSQTPLLFTLLSHPGFQRELFLPCLLFLDVVFIFDIHRILKEPFDGIGKLLNGSGYSLIAGFRNGYEFVHNFMDRGYPFVKFPVSELCKDILQLC